MPGCIVLGRQSPYCPEHTPDLTCHCGCGIDDTNTRSHTRGYHIGRKGVVGTAKDELVDPAAKERCEASLEQRFCLRGVCCSTLNGLDEAGQVWVWIATDFPNRSARRRYRSP